MSQFQSISPVAAVELLRTGSACLVDIRDRATFRLGHAPGAFHLTNETLGAFLQQTDPDHPVVVMCYHGHSSRGVAQYLVNHGFENVYNLEGGFAAWQLSCPVVSAGPDVAEGGV